MNADELKKSLIESGADEAGIRDRFGENVELFELCFKEFLNGAYAPALAEAIREKEYAKAFEAAHAIKGLSGNLGLNAYYGAICSLVESLRSKQYDHIDEQYAEAEKQFHFLQRISSGEKPLPGEPEAAAP